MMQKCYVWAATVWVTVCCELGLEGEAGESEEIVPVVSSCGNVELIDSEWFVSAVLFILHQIKTFSTLRYFVSV